jgi:hypothetical protein
MTSGQNLELHAISIREAVQEVVSFEGKRVSKHGRLYGAVVT